MEYGGTYGSYIKEAHGHFLWALERPAILLQQEMLLSSAVFFYVITNFALLGCMVLLYRVHPRKRAWACGALVIALQLYTSLHILGLVDAYDFLTSGAIIHFALAATLNLALASWFSGIFQAATNRPLRLGYASRMFASRLARVSALVLRRKSQSSLTSRNKPRKVTRLGGLPETQDKVSS